ncbi:MAG: acyltransferase domain-containing protein [SAR324 cluster bacterium]|nr:acyltransferase domain-containing protein [SAR324 cluster bacterium]
MSIANSTSMIILSAAGPQELAALCQTMLARLESAEADSAFQELLEQSSRPISADSARMGFVCESAEEASELLKTGLSNLEKKPGDEAWALRKGIYFRRQSMDAQSKVVALFSGQGSQYLGMLNELREQSPLVSQSFAAMDELFRKDGLPPLSEIIFPDPAEEAEEKKNQEARLTLTEHAQPAIGTVSVGLFKILQSAGLKVDATVGHSFGELTALWAAGVFDDHDYFFLAKARGRAMAAPDDPDFDAGSMLAVKADAEQVQQEAESLTDIKVANLNSDKQVVLAGPKQAVLAAHDQLKEKGFSVVLLPVAAAFHTPLVGHAQKPFAEAIRSVPIHPAKIPVYSNSTGGLYPKETSAIQGILEEHILNSVLFKTQIENSYKDGGRIYIEFGPKGVLTALVSSILADQPHATVAVNANPRKSSVHQFQDAMLQLRILGLDLKEQ